MLYVAGIAIAVFLQLLLVSKKNKSESDRILTAWMFVIVIHMFLFYLFYTGDIFRVPFLLGIEHPVPLLHGVLLYLYVSTIVDQRPANDKLLLLHFVPAAVLYCYLATFFILPTEAKLEVYRNRGAGFELFLTMKTWMILASGIIYVAWSALLLHRHARRVREEFSNLDKVNLRWLRILTYGLGCIWLLLIVTHNDAAIFSGVVVFVFLIGFFGIRQAPIFIPALAHGTVAPVSDASDESADEIYQPKKYPKSGLTDDASLQLHRELIRRMTGEALFTKSDLSMNELAAELGVQPNHLSQTINQIEKKNFYDFVNGYRIEEFKRRIAMPDNQQYTLLSVAYDCGFNSKSSFNRYFKKATGQTPSEYLAKRNDQSGSSPE